MWHPMYTVACFGVATTIVAWLAKVLLWDPIADLRAAQAAADKARALDRDTFVTQEELQMHVQELATKLESARNERNDGEGRILRSIEASKRETARAQGDIRQDIRSLVARVDEVMRSRSH